MTLIAQITDPHLRDDNANPCHDPVQTMRDAFTIIAAMDRRPDAIVLTGDIIDRSALGYGHALPLLSEAPVPVLPIPGNHDHAAAFRTAFAGWADFQPDHLSFTAAVGKVLLIALDSNLPGRSAGVDQRRLDWLAGVLSKATAPAILALHHPPFPTMVPHLEKSGFAGTRSLAALIKGSAIRRVIAGHSHRSIRTPWAGIEASTAPAIGHGLSLAFTGTEPAVPTCSPPGFELHDLRTGNVISHQISC